MGDCVIQDLWEIANLPFDWESKSTKSSKITKLLQKREEDHNSAIEKMKVKFDEVNKFVEERIRTAGNDLKETVLKTREKATKICEELEKKSDELETITNEIINERFDDLLELDKYSIESIDNFNSYLRCLENLRIERFKAILQETYTELYEIMHLPPKELEKYFEEEIIRINQLIMNNLRVYTDLHSKIQSQHEKAILDIYYRINEFRSKWKKSQQQKFIGNVTQSLGELHKAWREEFIKDEDRKILTNALNSSGDLMNDLMNQKVHPENSQEFLQNIQKVLIYMDEYSKSLLELYKKTVNRVFYGYVENLSDIKADLIERGVFKTSDIKLIDSRLLEISDVITGSDDNITEDVEILKKNWGFLSDLLKEKLGKPFIFLSTTASLWDEHNQRLEEAQELVTKDLNKLIEKNDTACLLQEVQVNISLDILRQQSNEEDLKSSLRDVFALYDKIKKKHISNYQSELKIIDKYSQLTSMEIEVLTSELKLFLNSFPKPDVYFGESTPDVLFFPNNEGIFQKINVVEHKIFAVENWMTGLRETIATYETNCRQEITTKSDAWISSQKIQLLERLDIKLCFHESRYERTKINVYDKRLAEINTHMKRLINHKKAVEEELEKMKDDAAEYQTHTKQIISSFVEKGENIIKQINKCKTESCLRSLIAELNFSKKNCFKEFDLRKRELEMQHSRRIQFCKKATKDFIDNIRLFSENGNFGIAEAKNFIKNLIALDKGMAKKQSQVLSDLSVKRSRSTEALTKTANDIAKPFLTALREFGFINSINNHIEALQSTIKNIAIELKGLVSARRSEFDDIKSVALDLLEEDQQEVLIQKLDNLLKGLKELCFLLYHTQAFTNDYSKYFKPYQQAITSASTTSSARESKSTKSITSALTTGKKTIIPIYPPKDYENTSFGKFSRLLRKYYDEIFDETKKYYSSVTEVKSKNILKPNFEEEITDIIFRINYYYLQCEGFWLEETNSLLEIFNDVQTFLIGIDSKCIINKNKNYQQRFDTLSKDITNDVINLIEENLGIVRKVHRQLRPLYGSRKNANLLENLKIEYENARETALATIQDLPHPYDVYVEEQEENHNKNLISSYEKMQLFKNFLIEFGSLVTPIIPQFETVLDNIVRFVQEDTVSQFDLISQKKVQFYKDSMPIPENYRIVLNNSKEVLKDLSLNSDDFSFISGSIQSSIHLSNPNLESFSKINKEICDTVVHNIIDLKQNAEQEIEEDKNMFNSDIEAILDLYVLKYDAGGKEPEPEKPQKAKKDKKK